MNFFCFTVIDLEQKNFSPYFSFNASRREALCARFSWLACHDIHGVFSVRDKNTNTDTGTNNAETVEVSIVFCATVEQECVVTLRPVLSDIQGESVFLLKKKDSLSDQGDSHEIDRVDNANNYIYYSKDRDVVDIAEYVIQEIFLLLPDYPRVSEGLQKENELSILCKTRSEMYKPFAQLSAILHQEEIT